MSANYSPGVQVVIQKHKYSNQALPATVNGSSKRRQPLIM